MTTKSTWWRSESQVTNSAESYLNGRVRDTIQKNENSFLLSLPIALRSFARTPYRAPRILTIVRSNSVSSNISLSFAPLLFHNVLLTPCVIYLHTTRNEIKQITTLLDEKEALSIPVLCMMLHYAIDHMYGVVLPSTR